jgi:hypothetical protein
MRIDCGGCSGIGSHRRHCINNPNYSREAELADAAENLGDNIGANNPAAANACYRAAALLRANAADG